MHHLSSIIIYPFRTIDNLQNCHGWEDFFDFSRMSIPDDLWAVYRRLEGNLYDRFLGNYVRIWVVVLSIGGILADRHQLFGIGVASSILMFLWISWGAATSQPSTASNTVLVKGVRRSRLTTVGQRVSRFERFGLCFHLAITSVRDGSNMN